MSTKNSNNNNNNNNKGKAETAASEHNDTKDAPADFETAIDAVGFGWYNVALLVVACLAAMATVFETSTVSYILQSAECDLNLTLVNKGMLNAITYVGMITSAIFWGYIADTKGRKNVLFYGLLADGVCVLGSAMSQNVLTLMIFKYLGGFIVAGPFAVLMTYLTELHSRQYRERIMMAVGIMFSTASLVLPTLALAILPNEWNFKISDLNFHSWQVFLAVCSIPSLLSGTILFFYPESPKFLMTQGRNSQAMEVFKTIYAMNKRKPRDSYPIKELVCEISEKHGKPHGHTVATIEGLTQKTKEDKKSMSWHDGLLQLRPLFQKPYLSLSLRVYLLSFCLLMGQNTTRLWLPQLFASIAEFEQKSQAASSMCAILEYSVNKTAMVHEYAQQTCHVVITASAYMNNIIVALASFAGYTVAGMLVNLLGGKWIMTIAMVAAGSAGIGLYWSASSLATLIVSSIFVTMGSISSTSLIGASASLFPTSLRTMIISLTMMIGRTGSITGNVLFPIFMTAGCLMPFVMISFVMFFGSVLAGFLPSTKKLALK